MHVLRPTLVQLLCALVLAGACAQAVAAGERVTYPRPESGSATLVGYYWRLLEAALSRTTAEFGPAEATPTEVVMNHQRAMDELVAGNIQVYIRSWLPPEYNDRLEMVPVPLDKGLLGYRVFLVHKDTQARLAKVATLADLKAFSMGQGATWADAGILAGAGLDVVKTSSYEGLFPMLQNKRFDLFPRAVTEVMAEHAQYRSSAPDLVVDDGLLLAYPLSFYFMVRKGPQGERLHKRLALGLQRMRADGSFERMYQEFKRSSLAGLSLKGRRLIRIDNPGYAGPAYARGENGYWDNLAAELRR